MPCYHPITGYRSRVVNPSGKRSIVFNPNLSYSDWDPVQVPCGRCIGCRLERSRQWAIRCVHEASLHKKNCFLTLTYNPDSEHAIRVLDKVSGEYVLTLDLRHIQLFLKRVRKKYGSGIRFFQCGEYGEKHDRPHFHVILFNHDFDDRKAWGKPRNGVQLYTSEQLKELWPYGFSTVGNCTFESAAYVARYITKKVNGVNSTLHYGVRKPEFITMSRRPGIGREWYTKFRDNVFPNDYIVLRNIKMKPPKFYENIYEKEDLENYERIKLKRITFGKLSEHNTSRRLADRERIQIAKFSKLIRPYEKETMKNEKETLFHL